jgi:hypothetical protein
MDRRFQPTSPVRVLGREELEALAGSVIRALQRAGLADVTAELRRRVLDRAADEVCESVKTSEAVFHLTYKPMIELLLYEVRDVARMPHLSTSHRRERIIWALSMAGL